MLQYFYFLLIRIVQHFTLFYELINVKGYYTKCRKNKKNIFPPFLLISLDCNSASGSIEIFRPY